MQLPPAAGVCLVPLTGVACGTPLPVNLICLLVKALRLERFGACRLIERQAAAAFSQRNRRSSMAADAEQWHLRPQNANNPVVFFGAPSSRQGLLLRCCVALLTLIQMVLLLWHHH